MNEIAGNIEGLSAAVVYAYRQDGGDSRSLAYLIGKLEHALQHKAAVVDVAGNAVSADVVLLRSQR